MPIDKYAITQRMESKTRPAPTSPDYSHALLIDVAVAMLIAAIVCAVVFWLNGLVPKWF